jgi:hypothetical protein
VTDPREKPAGHDTTPGTAPSVPPMRLSEEDLLELRDPDYDLGEPDYPQHWLARHPGFIYVIAERPGLRPGQPSIIDKFLGRGPIRSHDPEPDFEAEP